MLHLALRPSCPSFFLPTLEATLYNYELGFIRLSFSVRLRLDTAEGMNCAEFLYPIFQAYDFLHLCKHYDCRLQVSLVLVHGYFNISI